MQVHSIYIHCHVLCWVLLIKVSSFLFVSYTYFCFISQLLSCWRLLVLYFSLVAPAICYLFFLHVVLYAFLANKWWWCWWCHFFSLWESRVVWCFRVYRCFTVSRWQRTPSRVSFKQSVVLRWSSSNWHAVHDHVDRPATTAPRRALSSLIGRTDMITSGWKFHIDAKAVSVSVRSKSHDTFTTLFRLNDDW